MRRRTLGFVMIGTAAAATASLATRGPADAPTRTPPPPLADWFRFHEGAWAYEFPGGHGTSTCRYDHSDKVVHITTAGEIGGRSFSGSFLGAPRPAEGHWKAVWADSFENYLDITVTRIDGVLTSSWSMATPQTGEPILMRQEYRDITPGSFRDRLLVSNDSGETWAVARDALYTYTDDGG